MFNLGKIIRQTFAFIPERSNRFFTLRIYLKKEIPLSDKIIEQHQKYLKIAEDKGQVIYAVKAKQNDWHQYLFQSPNEVQPYKFIKKSILNTQNLVESYQINEIEMQLKVRDKQLAPSYLRQ